MSLSVPLGRYFAANGLFSLNVYSGDTQWQTTTSVSPLSPGITPSGAVVAPVAFSSGYAAFSSTGATLWTVQLPSPGGAPCMGPGDMFFVAGSGQASTSGPYLAAIATEGGAVIWTFTPPDVPEQPEAVTDPALSLDGTLVVVGMGTTVVAVGSALGQLVWSVDLSATTSGEVVSVSFAPGGDVLVLVHSGVVGLNVGSGATLWTYTAEGQQAGSMAVGVGGLLYLTLSNGVQAVNATTGTGAWWVNTTSPPVAVMVAAGDVVLYVVPRQDEECTVYAVDQSSGQEVWSFDVELGGGAPVGLALSPGPVLVLTSTNGVIGISGGAWGVTLVASVGRMCSALLDGPSPVGHVEWLVCVSLVWLHDPVGGGGSRTAVPISHTKPHTKPHTGTVGCVSPLRAVCSIVWLCFVSERGRA